MSFESKEPDLAVFELANVNGGFHFPLSMRNEPVPA
jgi:hypothetical protein